MTDKQVKRLNWIKANRSWRTLRKKHHILHTMNGAVVGLFLAVSLMAYLGNSLFPIEFLAVAWITLLVFLSLFLLPIMHSILKEWREFDKVLEADPTLMSGGRKSRLLQKLIAFSRFSRASKP